jgi:hypothetical protein
VHLQILLEISLVCHIFACGVSFTTVLPFLGEHGERDGAATFWATLPPPFPVWTGNASDAITDPVLPHYVAPESRYIAALYYACWNVLCVGMGDCKGLLDSERLLTAIMELVGAFIIAYASAYISSVIQQSSGRKHRLDRRSRALTMWIEEAGLPPDLVDRLVADCEVSDDSPAALVGKVVDDVSKSLARQVQCSALPADCLLVCYDGLIGSPAAWAPMHVAERRCGYPRFSRRNRTDIASWICLHRPSERPLLRVV